MSSTSANPSTNPLLAPIPTRSGPSSKPLFFIPSVNEHVFHAHSPMSVASSVTLQSAGVGLLVSAVQNALGTHDKGAMGVITRTGGTIGLFAAMGFGFSYTQAAVANMRETDDALNGAAGGCAAGFIAGVKSKSLPMAVGACAAMGTMIGTFSYAGKTLAGDRQSLPRPEREERRLAFFKDRKTTGEASA